MPAASGEAVPPAAQSASPLTLLPDPLLRLIFGHVISSYHPAIRCSESYRDYYPAGPYSPLPSANHIRLRRKAAGFKSKLGWVHFTHTCQRLRNVALDADSAGIWGSSICAVGPQVMPVLLERAHDASLSVVIAPDDWDTWESESQILLDLIRNNASRLERISVVLPSFSELDASTRDPRSAHCTQFHAAVLDTLADKDLPLLNHLDLSYTPYASTPSSPLSTSTPFTAPNLTSLRLSRQRISADHLYDILRSSLDLASLSIDWIPSDSASLIQLPLKDAEAPLHMPNLKDLSMSTHDFPSVLAVWKLLIPCRDVRASFNATTSDAREFQSALNALSPLFYRAGLHNLSLHTSADTFTFRMLPKRNIDHSPSLSVTTTRAPDSIITPSELLDTFLRFIDASWLDSLHLDVLSLSKPALSILSGFDTIVEMSCPFSSRSILHQLSSTADDEDPVFPSMGTLTLKDEDADDDGGKEKWDVVQKFLKGRREKSVEVDCVRLVGSKGSGSTINGRSSVGRKSVREVDKEGLQAVRELVTEVVDRRN